MPTRKATPRRRRTVPPDTAARLRQGWETTIASLATAEKDAERRVKKLVKENRHELEGRLTALQVRLRKEQKAVVRNVQDAVHGALAALDIPSRKEVAELTRKVELLTKKMGASRRATL